jgi:hypothetical protein
MLRLIYAKGHEKMPTKKPKNPKRPKKHFTTRSTASTTAVLIKSGATDADLCEAAREIGVPADRLRRIVDFSETLRIAADEADLVAPEIVSALLNIIGELIRGCYPQEKQHLLLMDIHHQLTAVVGGVDNGTTH